MKICIDARYFTPSGASTYINNVIPRLLALDGQNSYYLVKYAWQTFPFEAEFDHVFSPSRGGKVSQLLWVYFRLPRLLSKFGIDLYHPMKFAGAPWKLDRTVITCHSISKPYHGEFPLSKSARLYGFLYADRLFRHVVRIIAVSEFLGDYLVEMHGIAPGAIDVIPHGVDDAFRPLGQAEVDRVLKARGLQPGFVLCAGNVFRVKNHVTAVRAMANYLEEGNRDLVFAGSTDDPYFQTVREEVRKLKLEGRVHFLGFVPKDELSALMNAAFVMLFPSLSEGAGLALLEAFACGLPVIASRRGGILEIGRDTAIFVDDPYDAVEFGCQIKRIEESPSLRDELRRRCIEKAASYSWDACAAKHIEAYEKAHRFSAKL